MLPSGCGSRCRGSYDRAYRQSAAKDVPVHGHRLVPRRRGHGLRHRCFACALCLCVVFGASQAQTSTSGTSAGPARAAEAPERPAQAGHHWIASGFVKAGFVAAGLGAHAWAVSLYSQAITRFGEDNPAAVAAFVGRAASLSRLGRHEEALKDKEWIMRGMPAHADASFQLAAQDELSATIAKAARAEEARDFNRAIELYSLALSNDSLASEQRRRALKGRALAYEQVKRFSEAEEDLSALARMTPTDVSLHFRRGHFYLDRDRLDDAYAVFDAGARLNPSDPGFRHGKGRVHSARKEFAAAIVEYTEAIRLMSGVSVYYLWRAEAYVQLKMYPEALADYDQALATGWLIPRDKAQLYLGRGFLYLNTREFELALRDLDRALGFNPDNANGRRWRGLAYEQLGHRKRALEDYEYALRLMPSDGWLAERIAELRAS
jgi:tetratricopeptide (TPR) repeat protein